MNRRGRSRVRTHLVALLALGAGVFAVAGAGPSSAQVSTVVGGAFGYSARITLFTAPQDPVGPAPSVTLPESGSATPITATAPSANVKVGPATLFTSGPIEVSTEGTTGPTGSVTSSTEITDVNTSGLEVFTADAVTSTCTASEAEESGTTTVTGGSVILEDPDSDVAGEPGEVVQTIAAQPAPNTEYMGTIANVNDQFRIVFNEQIANPDGSITVNAVHEYLLGPSAVGDVIIGSSTCGVNPTAVVTTTTAAGGQTPTTIRVGELVRTGSESDLMIAFAAMALTVGALLVMGAKGLPGQDDPPPAEPDGARRPPPPG